MHSKNELIGEIDKLIGLMRTRSTSAFALIFLPARFVGKVNEFSGKCVDLKKRVVLAANGPTDIFELEKEFLDLELWIKRRVAKNSLLPTWMGIYAGFGLIFAALKYFDIPYFITKTLGVSAPERLVTLGIAGAIVYLATSLLSKVNQKEISDPQLFNVIDFSIRLSLAIIVPIILVILFFKPDGTIGEFAITPELLSFSCGYSAKLVLDVFNKLVEKASKMIEAI